MPHPLKDSPGEPDDEQDKDYHDDDPDDGHPVLLSLLVGDGLFRPSSRLR
jgi:hypothetical protein